MKYLYRTLLISMLLLFFSADFTFSQELLIDTLGYKNAKNIDVSDLDDKEYYLDSIGLSIRPPRYFVKMENESVFLHVQTSSSIAIDYLGDYPYVMVTENMTAEHLEMQGASLIEEMDIKTIYGYTGKLYIMEFNIKGVDFLRLMFFTGDLNRSFIAVANYPKMMDEIERQAVIKSFQTIKF